MKRLIGLNIVVALAAAFAVLGVNEVNEKNRRHSNASTMDRTSDAYVYGSNDTNTSYSYSLAYADRC
tara:strand:+ start:82 stop:282 length:201 start_codon:yes stop_codon:yes gene_type:complete